MGPHTPEQRLTADLARAAVAATAPDEIALFDVTCAAYRRRPVGPDWADAGAGSDDPLGFGIDLSLPVLTVAALAAAEAVVVFVVTEVLREEGSAIVRAWIARVLRRLRHSDAVASDAAGVPTGLTPEQLARVRRCAYEQALAFRVPQREAEIMADAIAGRLSLPDDG